jgi:hypothetical protein
MNHAPRQNPRKPPPLQPFNGIHPTDFARHHQMALQPVLILAAGRLSSWLIVAWNWCNDMWIPCHLAIWTIVKHMILLLKWAELLANSPNMKPPQTLRATDEQPLLAHTNHNNTARNRPKPRSVKCVIQTKRN